MRELTKIAIVTLTLGTTSLLAYSDDYALTDSYKLFNDMKLAQKQQGIIVDIVKELQKDNINIKSLKSSQKRFHRVLIGLIDGDKSLNIKGTKLPKVRAKLNELKILWYDEIMLIKRGLKDIDIKEKAIANLNHIMLKTSEIVEFYNKSYSRFKQKSKISSIVNRKIMGRRIQRIAFNSF
jgi:hypothetical protein